MGLKFDGVDIEATYGLMIDGVSTWVKPERDVELVHVPGRNGDLIFDNGCWHNVEISYRMLIRSGWKSSFEAFTSWLCGHIGYFRLEDQERHPGVYRMAEFIGPIEPELQFTTETGEFTIIFNCKPQQFLTSGEVAILSPYPGTILGKAEENAGVYSFIWSNLTDDLKYRSTLLIPTEQTFTLTVSTKADAEPGEVTVTFLAYDTANDAGLQSAYCSQATSQITSLPDTLTFSYTPDAAVNYVRVCVEADQILDRFTYSLMAGQTNIPFIPAWQIYPLENPTNFESSPTINVKNGPWAFVLNSDIAISFGVGATFPIIFDGELETCYQEVGNTLVSMNEYVNINSAFGIRDFPYLKTGMNYIDFATPDPHTVYSGQVYTQGDIEITPRWYTI